MALVACPIALGDLDLGQLAANGSGTKATVALDGTNTKYAFTFAMPVAATPNVVGFEIVAVTSAQDMKIGIYALDTTNGDPTTLVGSEVDLLTASVTAAWHEVAGLGAALTAGLPYAVVFSWAGAAGAITLRILQNPLVTRGWVDLHYTQAYTTSWQAKSTGNLPILYLETSGGITIPLFGARPVLDLFSASFVSGDRVCLRFQSPIRGEVVGVRCSYTTAANHQIAAVLYADDGTTLLSGGPTIDEDYTAENGNSARMLFLTTPVTVEIGTWYRLGMELGSTINIWSMVVNAAKHLDGMEGGGQTFHYIDYTSGAWNAAVTTKRPMIVPLFRSIDTAVAGGGGLRLAGHGGLAA